MPELRLEPRDPDRAGGGGAVSTQTERSLDNAAELRRLAGIARDEAHRAMAAGGMAEGAEWLRKAERGERVASSIEARAEAARYQAQAINHRNVGHFDQADEAERMARDAERRAAEVAP